MPAAPGARCRARWPARPRSCRLPTAQKARCGQRGRRAQRRGCRLVRHHPQATAHEGMQCPQQHAGHQHHQHAQPPRRGLRRHPQKARNLKPVPIQVDWPAEQRGRHHVAVAAQHHQGVERSHPRQRTRRHGTAPARPREQRAPQDHELGRDAVVGPHHGRGPPQVEAQQAAEQQHPRQPAQRLPRRHGLRHGLRHSWRYCGRGGFRSHGRHHHKVIGRTGRSMRAIRSPLYASGAGVVLQNKPRHLAMPGACMDSPR